MDIVQHDGVLRTSFSTLVSCLVRLLILNTNSSGGDTNTIAVEMVPISAALDVGGCMSAMVV
jgi:hypothetical protein